jgi:23S rRNA (guanosine2251-2'-O)-methyltransferase
MKDKSMKDKNVQIAVVLDNVRSVHNVGSIFRTADAVGASKIYCCGITPSPLDRFGNVRADFAKVALGAEKSVAWEAGDAAGGTKSTADILHALKKDGWKIFAVEQAKNSVPYYEAFEGPRDASSEQKIALILGAEVDGVSPEALALADAVLEIPMRGKKESLNVAVAFGIVAYGLLRHPIV